MIHKKVCQHCGTKKDLTKISKATRKDGKVVQYYMCNTHNRERKRAWYHSNPDNKRKVQVSNMKSMAKRFGYKLTKI